MIDVSPTYTVFELGSHHFHFISKPYEIELALYSRMTDEEKQNIKVKKFGAKFGDGPTPIDIIRYPSGMKTFRGIRRSYESPFSTATRLLDWSVELEDDLGRLIKGPAINEHVDIFVDRAVPAGYVRIDNDCINDPDIQTLCNYIQLTR